MFWRSVSKDNIKALLLSIIFVLLLLSVCAGVDYADEITVNQTINNDTNCTLVNDTHYSHEIIHENGVARIHKVVVEKPKYPLVTITAKPSCGCGKYWSYRWRTKSYINYCPHCHRYGVLANVHKYPARHEQELTCKHCGADYCGNCGHEKYSWSYYYLRKPWWEYYY